MYVGQLICRIFVNTGGVAHILPPPFKVRGMVVLRRDCINRLSTNRWPAFRASYAMVAVVGPTSVRCPSVIVSRKVSKIDP